MAPSEIDYINAHGTGTKLNDPAETAAIKAVFGEHAARIPISSTKSMIGHLMAAAGGPEFIVTVLSVERDQVHPTRNLTAPDPKCDLDYAPQARRTPVRAALSNSFGFGGQNASIIVRKTDYVKGEE
jgi:3-oxoacyl-[acyl-carrier-protein] synthase II